MKVQDNPIAHLSSALQHDMKNALVIINFALETNDKDIQDGARVAMERLRHIADSLGDASYTTTLANERFDIRDALRDLPEVHFELPEHPLYIQGDSLKFIEAFLAFRNATKASGAAIQLDESTQSVVIVFNGDNAVLDAESQKIVSNPLPPWNSNRKDFRSLWRGSQSFKAMGASLHIDQQRLRVALPLAQNC